MELPTFIRDLEKKLQEELPGIAAQSLMSPVHHRNYLEVHKDHKIACVSCLLHEDKNGWNVILIERQNIHPEDKHGGQLGFPGGKLELEDVSLERCALRETEEEIGISSDKIQILGRLSELYVYVSRFLVHPFVGYISSLPELIPEPSEVRSILHFPISNLSRDGIKKKKDLKIRNNVIKDVPYYDVGGKILWGATAMMMSELEHIINGSDNRKLGE